jgi:hypothetical protein
VRLNRRKEITRTTVHTTADKVPLIASTAAGADSGSAVAASTVRTDAEVARPLAGDFRSDYVTVNGIRLQRGPAETAGR